MGKRFKTPHLGPVLEDLSVRDYVLNFLYRLIFCKINFVFCLTSGLFLSLTWYPVDFLKNRSLKTWGRTMLYNAHLEVFAHSFRQLLRKERFSVQFNGKLWTMC